MIYNMRHSRFDMYNHSPNIRNAGTDGAKRDAIMEYLEGTLPSRNTKEQNTQLVSNILKDMNSSNLISSDGKLWRAPK